MVCVLAGISTMAPLPRNLALGDASTRVKMRVGANFFELLYEESMHHDYFFGSFDNPIELLDAELRVMCCSLDTEVRLTFDRNGTVALNDPHIYEKDSSCVWDIISSPPSESSDNQNQASLLSPMKGADEKLYGYGAINITESTLMTIRSVGGIGQRTFGGYEAICGIIEYKTTSARRDPHEIAVPRDVMEAWSQKQIKAILENPLTDEERVSAMRSMGSLDLDIRPIFFVKTSSGGLTLPMLIQELKERRLLIALGNIYGVVKEEKADLEIYTELPRVQNEFRLTADDIEFDELTLLSLCSISRRRDDDRKW